MSRLKHRDKQSKALAAHGLSIAFLLSAAGQALRAIKVNVIARDKWHYVRAEGLTQ